MKKYATKEKEKLLFSSLDRPDQPPISSRLSLSHLLLILNTWTKLRTSKNHIFIQNVMADKNSPYQLQIYFFPNMLQTLFGS